MMESAYVYRLLHGLFCVYIKETSYPLLLPMPEDDDDTSNVNAGFDWQTDSECLYLSVFRKFRA
jgi:hypothetical protein